MMKDCTLDPRQSCQRIDCVVGGIRRAMKCEDFLVDKKGMRHVCVRKNYSSRSEWKSSFNRNEYKYTEIYQRDSDLKVFGELK